MSEQVVAYFDGLCEDRNPGGYGCGGYVVEPFSNFEEGLRGGKFFGHGEGMTNNIASYEAALLVLRVIYHTGWRGPVLLKGDSQTVVKQFTGEHRCNSPLLLPLLEKLGKASESFSPLILEWISKHENEAADAESQKIYEEITGQKVPVRFKKVR